MNTMQIVFLTVAVIFAVNLVGALIWTAFVNGVKHRQRREQRVRDAITGRCRR